MKKPHEIAKILKQETRACESDYTSHGNGGKQYRYYLHFDGMKSISNIKKKVNSVSEIEGIPLEVTIVSPVMEQRESSIQALVRVWVKETEDRNELENENLEDYF